MKEKSFIINIKQCGQFFERGRLLRVFSNHTSLTPSHKFREVALNPNSSYKEIYLTGIRGSEYNILLEDYSYFQFSILDAKDLELRYGYYPNPFIDEMDIEMIKGLDDELESGILSFEEYSQLLSELNTIYNIPFIRYDVDYGSYNFLKHPTSHFHIGIHKGNRWPVERVLTPFMFCLFIAKLYYPKNWEEFGDNKIKDNPIHNRFDKRMIDEKKRCKIIPAEFFPDPERLHLYIG